MWHWEGALESDNREGVVIMATHSTSYNWKISAMLIRAFRCMCFLLGKDVTTS